MRPSESVRHVWRDAAMTLALGLGDSPSINVTAGRGVGGSSALTGGVCFRAHDHVLRRVVEGRPARARPARDGRVVLDRRARRARRDRARRDALEEHAPLHRGRQEARHPVPLDAAQHRRLQRLRPLQLRLPAPGEDERRHRVPAARRTRRRAHLERLPRRPRADRAAIVRSASSADCSTGRTGSRRATSSCAPVTSSSSAGAMYTPLLLATKRHRRALGCGRKEPHAPPELPRHRALRRARPRLGRRAPERVLRSLGRRGDDPQQRLHPERRAGRDDARLRKDAREVARHGLAPRDLRRHAPRRRGRPRVVAIRSAASRS